MKRYKLFAYMLGSFIAGYLTFYLFKYIQILGMLNNLINR